MQVTEVDLWHVKIPQKEPVAPYRSRIRTSSETCSGIVRLRTDSGLEGWGEFNINFLPDVDLASQTQAASWMIGRNAVDIQGFHRETTLEMRLRSGIEIAMWDLLGKAAGLPVAKLLGGILRPQVELAACMGIQSYDRAGELAQHYVDQGFTTLKTKAGASIDEDLEMVRGVRDAVGMQLKLRIDPNRSYSLEDAMHLAKELEVYELEYLEQPIMAEPLSDACQLREATTTPLALNESVLEPPSAWKILHAEAAEFLLPDTPQAGGILPCIEIGQMCHAASVPCIMHCGHDLGPKTAAMVHVAASQPAYSLANDSTYYGLVDDVLSDPLPIHNGRISVPTVPGLGADCDLAKLERFKMS